MIHKFMIVGAALLVLSHTILIWLAGQIDALPSDPLGVAVGLLDIAVSLAILAALVIWQEKKQIKEREYYRDLAAKRDEEKEALRKEKNEQIERLMDKIIKNNGS